MNLHEVMQDEWNSAFLNLDEFACEHDFAGRKVRCIVSDRNAEAVTHTGSDLSNISGLGIIQCDRVVYCSAAEMLPEPLPGQKIEMDGQFWYVADFGVGETEGLFRLPLNRAF